MQKLIAKTMKQKLLIKAVANNVKKTVLLGLEENEENRLCKDTVLSNKVLCAVLAYAFPYHAAVAKMTQLSVKALRLLE